jgi:16S rRNA (cytosine1402-N4)-methyltransferase
LTLFPDAKTNQEARGDLNLMNTQTPNFLHEPVMLERTIELLGPALAKDKAVLVDCTLGLGGHSEAFLMRFPSLTVVGIDRDQIALDMAGERLASFQDRIKLFHGTYDQVDEALEVNGFSEAEAILMDLGVSSMQIDSKERGFAYSFDAPLDMRMDLESGSSAANLIAESSEAELARIFKEYGEERFASKIANELVARRKVAPITTSKQLAEIISQVVPFIPGKSSGHPAKRVFQALRIAVNEELEILERAVPGAIDALAVGGRLLVLSYHSLEDRIVKQAIAKASTSSAPVELPFELPEHAPVLKLVVKGAEKASLQEIASNPRSASVRLRAAEKIRKVA